MLLTVLGSAVSAGIYECSSIVLTLWPKEQDTTVAFPEIPGILQDVSW